MSAPPANVHDKHNSSLKKFRRETFCDDAVTKHDLIQYTRAIT